MMNTLKFDVVVIGGGPAGMAAALSARKQGASTLILERDVRLGGILNHIKVSDFITSAKR